MSIEDNKLSPLDKLKLAEERIKSKHEEVKQQEQSSKVEELKTALNEEMTYNNDRTEKYNKDSARINQLTEELKKPLAERDRLKQEGKIAASKLRETEAGQAVVRAPKEDELKQEIFGDTIKALKEIKDFVNLHKKEFETEIEKTKREMTSDSAENQKIKHQRIKEFKEKYPEIDDIHRKMEYLKDARNFLERHKQEVESFLANPEMKDFLDDEIVYDRLEYGGEGIIDRTLERELKKLREELDSVRKDVHDRNEIVHKEREKGKGFFEKEKSFEEKIDKKLSEIRDYEHVAERRIIYGEGGGRGIQELDRIKSKIENELLSMLRIHTRSYSHGRELMEQKKTVQDFLTSIKADMEKELSEKKLSEEEQLIKDLNDELWR